MSNYPILEEMGIKSFSDVSHYKVRNEHRADVLKIYYKRAPGSLLSRSKKYTFVHPSDAVPLQYRGQKNFDQLQYSSPKLLNAIEELEKLTNKTDVASPVNKQQFLSELDHLEKVMLCKIEELRAQANQMI